MVTCERCHRKFSSYAALKQHYANQHSNAKWPNELENQLIAEKNSEQYKATIHPSRSSHFKLVISLVLIVTLLGAGWYYIQANSPTPTITGDPTLQICSTGAAAEHIHPHLAIVVNGQPINIPANIGISPSCMRPIHTHDESGTIHVESPVSYPFTLHDSFLVWGQPFDKTQILQNRVDSTHTLKMTINGIPNTQFENYVLRDGDQIVITYGSAT